MGTKKTSTPAAKSKTAEKPKTQEVPAVVSKLKSFAVDLRNNITVSDLPESERGGRDKLAANIDRYAARVEKILAGAGKAAEKEAAKVDRAAAKREKAMKRVADLKTKLADAEKALES